jgi:hypothetical protein
VINVTLTFSSVAELLEFFTTSQAPATAVKVETAPAVPKPKRAAPAPVPAPEPEAAPGPSTATPTEAPAPVAAPEPAPEPEAAPGVAYADLQKAVLALYTKDRAKAAGIATEMGFASFKVMPAERWAEALAKVNAALEG